MIRPYFWFYLLKRLLAIQIVKNVNCRTACFCLFVYKINNAINWGYSSKTASYILFKSVKRFLQHFQGVLCSGRYHSRSQRAAPPLILPISSTWRSRGLSVLSLHPLDSSFTSCLLLLLRYLISPQPLTPAVHLLQYGCSIHAAAYLEES